MNQTAINNAYQKKEKTLEKERTNSSWGKSY